MARAVLCLRGASEMAFSKVDPSTGETKYSMPWMIGIFLVVGALAFGGIYFFVTRHSATMAANRPATAGASSRAHLDRIMASDNASNAETVRKSMDYFNSVGQKVSGESVEQFLRKGSGQAAKVTNDDSRFEGVFSRQQADERVRRLGNSAAAGDQSSDLAPGFRQASRQSAHGAGLTVMSWYGGNRAATLSTDAFPAHEDSGTAQDYPPASKVAELQSLQVDALKTLVGHLKTREIGVGGGSVSPVGDRPELEPADATTRRARTMSANSLPLGFGSHISVVLLNNVISSSSIRQRVWAITSQETVFRRQVQLPKGVLIGGYAGMVSRNQLEVNFDVMVFPDGTELRITGHAVNGYNPEYPGLEGIAGLVDVYREPPLWSQFMPVIIQFLVGYTNQAFPQNVVVSSTSGYQSADARGQLNNGINAAAQMMQQKAMAYLEQYTPYVYLRKGLPFKVELDADVDFSLRRLGGYTYADLMTSVKRESDRTAEAAQEASRRMSAPAADPQQYFGLPGNATPQDLQQRMNAVAAAMAAGGGR